jgi:hypothetical protein
MWSNEAMTEQSRPVTVRRLPKEELRALAVREYQGEVLVTDDPHIAELSFKLMLSFGALSNVRNIDDIGALIGYMNHTLPMGVNGWPIFLRMGFLHKDDRDAFQAYRDEIHNFMSDEADASATD